MTNVAVTYVASVSQCGVLFTLRVLRVLRRRLASARPLPSVSNTFSKSCAQLTGSHIIDSLIVDTGSSNTWVGADQKYVKTSTSKSTGQSVVCLLV